MALKEPLPLHQIQPQSVCSPSALAWAWVPRAQRMNEWEGEGRERGAGYVGRRQAGSVGRGLTMAFTTNCSPRTD